MGESEQAPHGDVNAFAVCVYIYFFVRMVRPSFHNCIRLKLSDLSEILGLTWHDHMHMQQLISERTISILLLSYVMDFEQLTIQDT